LHQILRVGRERGAKHLWIGEREVRGRHRREHLIQIAQRVLARLVVDPRSVAGKFLGPARGDEISLLPEIEDLTVRPVGILEAVVARLRLDDRLDLLAEKAANRAAPEIGVARKQLGLRGGELGGLCRPMPRDLAERLGRFAGFRGHAVRALAVRVGPLGQRGESLGALIEETHHIPGEGFHVIGVDLFNPGRAGCFILLLHQSVLVLTPSLPCCSHHRIPGSGASATVAQGVIVLCNIVSARRLPIVTGNWRDHCSKLMLRALPSYASRLLALLIPLGLAACADTISSSEVTPSSELLKEYDKTLTKSEQKAAISDLEAAQAKARGETSPESTGATGAKSAQTQDQQLAAKGRGALAAGPVLFVM